MTAAVTSPIDAALDYVAGLLPFTDSPSPASPAAQRAKMLEQAGPDHFRSAALTGARDQLFVKRELFQQQRAGFQSTAFTESKERLRNGGTRPSRGPVIGGLIRTTLQDPGAARALIGGVAAGSGVPVIGTQPVLAALLPGFGN